MIPEVMSPRDSDETEQSVFYLLFLTGSVENQQIVCKKYNPLHWKFLTNFFEELFGDQKTGINILIGFEQFIGEFLAEKEKHWIVKP